MGIDLRLPSAEEALRPRGTAVAARSTMSPETQAAIQNRFGNLNAEEQAKVDDFAKTIDLHVAILSTEYALRAQGNIRSLTSSALKGVSGKDIGNIEELLFNMSVAIKDFNSDFEEEFDGYKILGIFRKAKRNVALSKERMQVRYKDVSDTLNGIVKELESRNAELKRDSEMIESLYAENSDFFKELTMYILAGQKALKDATEGELAELKRIANETNLPEDAQAYKDFQSRCSSFEKRLYDLELTRQITLQAAPQFRLIQSSNDDISQQITSAIYNAIPLWEHGITTGLALSRSERAGNAAQTVRDLTSSMLVRNAERLHANSVNAAKLSEEGFIDPDAIKECNRILIQTIADVSKIHSEGLRKRNEVRKDLGQFENDLKDALLQPYTEKDQAWIA